MSGLVALDEKAPLISNLAVDSHPEIELVSRDRGRGLCISSKDFRSPGGPVYTQVSRPQESWRGSGGVAGSPTFLQVAETKPMNKKPSFTLRQLDPEIELAYTLVEQFA
jgi:hypothetical protein